MNVAILQEHVDSARGGAETSTLEVARQLQRLGANVSVIGSAGRGPGDERRLPSSAAAAGTLSIRMLACPAANRWLRTRAFLLAAQALIERERPDIVQSMMPCLSCDVYQPRGGTYSQTIEQSVAMVANPVMRALRGISRRFNLRQRYLLGLERRMLRTSAPPTVAAVSALVASRVRAEFPNLGETRVRVVFNGVDFAPLTGDAAASARRARREALGVSDAERLMLFVAHNFRLKGLGELLRALALLDSVPWRLVVAGRDRSGPYASLAQRIGLASRVTFAGPAAQMAEWYAAADALVHPTWHDPCSRVVLEALGAGLPTVTTRLNGASEAVEPGVSGELVEHPGDIADLALALDRCLRLPRSAPDDPVVAARRERLSMARHARELMSLFESVLSRR